jgi:hypothetical protein
MRSGDDHRQGVRRWAGIAATLTVTGVVLAACGSGGGKAPSAAKTTPATKASPVASASAPGGWIPTTLDFRGPHSPVAVTDTNLFAFMTWEGLDGPWHPVGGSDDSTGDFPTGDEAVTDKYTRDGKPAQWTAKIVAGTPGPSVSAPLSGTAALEAYTTGVVDHTIVAQFYPHGTTVTPIASAPFTLDGYQCWLDAFRPHFQVAGVHATYATDVVVVANNVGSSGSQLGVFYISVPSDASQLLPDIPFELHSLALQH